MTIKLSGQNSAQVISAIVMLILMMASTVNSYAQDQGSMRMHIRSADSTGSELGLVKVSKTWEKNLGLSINETQTTYLSFRSGGRIFYGILGAGYNFSNKSNKYAYQAGIGARLLNSGTFHLKTELVASGLESFKGSGYYISSSYLLPAFKLSRSLEIFAGPSFNSLKTNSEEGKNTIKHYISSSTKGQNFQGFYFGYTFGIHLTIH